MSIFDGILGNIEGMAEKLGLPADQLKSVTETLQAKLGEGADMSALMQAAQEHGLPVEKIQEMLGGGSLQDMLGKAGDMLRQGKDGIGGALGDLGGMAKGLFGKD